MPNPAQSLSTFLSKSVGRRVPAIAPRTPIHRCLLRIGLPVLIVLLVVLIALPEPAWAQGAGGTLDNAIETMKRTVDQAGQQVGRLARQIMLSLLVVDFVLRAGRAVAGNEGLEPLIKGFAFQLGFVALIWFISTSISDIVSFLGDTMGKVVSHAGGKSLRPGDLVTDGLARAVGWLEAIELTSPGTWFYLFSAAISIIALAISVAMLVVIWAEFYLVALVGLIALSFGGLTETRDIATGFVKALLGKTFKLMGLMIIFIITDDITKTLAQTGAGFESVAAAILLQIVSVVLILTLPTALENIVGGPRLDSGAAEAVGGTVSKLSTKAMKKPAKAAVVGAARAAGAIFGAVIDAIKAGKSGASIGGMVAGAAKGAAKRGFNWGNVAARGNTLNTINSHFQNANSPSPSPSPSSSKDRKG